MSPASRIGLAIVALACCLSSAAAAADYAGAISAYRRAHGLAAVRLDSRLDAVARRQARAMAASSTVSHSVGGEFPLRVASLRKAIAAENIGAAPAGSVWPSSTIRNRHTASSGRW
jgi:uncharacterized protein YkwD